jgi:hypothetical protein
MSVRGGSATPRATDFFSSVGWFELLRMVKGVAPFFFYFFKKEIYIFFNFIIFYFFFNFFFLYSVTCQSQWRAVSFWTKNLTEVPIQYFLKIEVLSMIRIETQVPKNKIFKTQVPKRYLTIFLSIKINNFFLKKWQPR